MKNLRSVVCLTDGTVRSFEDDGTDKNGKPKVKRLIFLQALKKVFKGGGGQIFRSAKIVDGKYVAVPVPEDLTAILAPFDEAAEKILNRNLAERAKRENAAQGQSADLNAFLEKNRKVIEAASHLMANAQTSAPKAPKAKSDG